MNLRRATVWMAAGTGVSRITGLLRVIALAYALGFHHLADAFNLANTTPNMLHDIVLGGVLAATFIPVFVDRLATRSEREAWRAISAILTLATVVLVAMTIVSWIFAPEVIRAFTVFGHSRSSAQAGQLAQEQAVATTLLRWFVPQVALYGLIAMASALLNTRRRFVAPMWVPIVNNVVCIAVLLWFHQIISSPSLAEVSAHPSQLVLLGLGTTAGMVLQVLFLLPSLRGVGLSRLRWRWDPRHEAVRTIVRLGSWTFGFVIANQLALFVVLALAVGAPGTDPVSAYTYAYAFMLMPYAVVAVSVMSAVTPDLAHQWATGDVAAFRRRLSGGLRATLAVILPASMGMFLLARPLMALLLGHGTTTVSGTETAGAALAMFSLGLPGFCAFLYVVRVLQAMQRTRVAFWLYLLENGVNVVLAVALVHGLGVRGLALSVSVAYTVGAITGVMVLRGWLGTLGGAAAWSPLRRVVVATVFMGAVVLVVSNLSGADHGVALLLRVGGSAVVGAAVYAGAAAVMGGRARSLDLWGGSSIDESTPGEVRPVGGTAGPGGRAPGRRSVTPARADPGPRIRIVPRQPPQAAWSAPPRPEPPVPGPPRPSPVHPPEDDPAAQPPGNEDGPATAKRRASDAGQAHEDRVAARAPSQRTGLPGAGEASPGSNGAGEQEDDPGEVRWVGGTVTPLSRRLPR